MSWSILQPVGDVSTGEKGRGRMSSYLARGHHHTTTDGIKRVRSNTSTGSYTPSEQERSQEIALKRTDQQNWLDGVIHAEIETTIYDDT